MGPRSPDYSRARHHRVDSPILRMDPFSLTERGPGEIKNKKPRLGFERKTRWDPLHG